jgi:predicted transcriptional regulator
MAASKRTDFQREENYVQITALYLRGKYQSEIAKLLGLSQGMISQDLKVIQRRWRESTIMNLDEAKAKELARLDELEREFWAAWEASKGERTQARQEKNNAGATVKASMIKEQRDGNPAFLTGVLSCIDRRCKLLGLDAPTKSELEVTQPIQIIMDV